jgi:hypothetical protein
MMRRNYEKRVWSFRPYDYEMSPLFCVQSSCRCFCIYDGFLLFFCGDFNFGQDQIERNN